MTAKIKLNAASGGGSISIQAPSSSSNNRVIALPDIADGTLVTSQSTLDATKLSGNLPALNGSALTNLDAGKVLQIVNSQSSANKTTSGDTVLALASLSITPTSASNAILLFYSASVNAISSSKSEANLRIYRGTTSGTFLGGQVGGSDSSSNNRACFGLQHRDTPNTTSATTYTLAIKRKDSSTSYLTTDSTNYSITAMEIVQP